MNRAASGDEMGLAFGLMPLSERCARVGWRGKGGPGQAGGLRFGGRRVRRLPCGARSRGPSPNSLRSLRSLRSDRRRQVSSLSAPRARATSPPLLSAEEAPSGLPGPTFAEAVLAFVGQANAMSRHPRALALRDKPPMVVARRAVAGMGDFCGDEEHRPEVGARSALQHLTRRVCLSEAERSERSELCGATSGRAPQCSRRTRRPPQHEPLSATARRAALTPRERSRPRTATTRRKRASPRVRFCHAGH